MITWHPSFRGLHDKRAVHCVHAESAVHAVQVLDVNPGWRMNTVSDGQRRRVQLVMGLLKPFKAKPFPVSVYSYAMHTSCDKLCGT